jgi:pimeloyl-ACP methyl ester carboxylesterase
MSYVETHLKRLTMNNPPLSLLTEPFKLKRGSKNFIAYNRLDTKNKNLPEVLFLGGFKSDMMGTKATYLEKLCQNRGQTFTRFDYFGHGFSSGEFTEGTIGLWLVDTLAMIDQVTEGPLILVGSSMGGWLMVLAALARPKRICGLIGIAAAPDFTEELIWAGFTETQRLDFLRQGIIQTPSQYENEGFPITLQLVEEGRSHLVLPKPLPIQCPVHLIHGDGDRDVPFELSQRLAKNIKSPEVTLTLIKDGDHRLNTPLALGRLASILNEVSLHTR